MIEELKQVKEINPDILRAAKIRWNRIAKPIGGLGKLEDYIVQIAGITENTGKLDIRKKAVLIFCGDHKVTESGVTQTDSSVTKTVTDNFARGLSCVNYMAGEARADVFPVDVGMFGERYKNSVLQTGMVTDRRVGNGAKNIALEPAMTVKECEQAVRTGIQCVGELKAQGYSILAIGEMGIGNTTPTSALAAVWLKKEVREVTGRGAGLSDEGYQHKLKVLEQIMKRHERTAAKTAVEVLADIGGYEIVAMAGACIGGAIYHLPVIIDGAISEMAAFAAAAMEEKVGAYLLASHESSEPVGALALQALNLTAMLHCGMHLGEGSGAVALYPLLDMGVSVYNNMKTFDDIQIEAYVDYSGKAFADTGVNL